MAEFGKHAPDFAILALGKDQLDDRGIAFVGDRLDAFGSDLAFGEPDTFDELLVDLGSGRSRDDRSIDFLDTELGVSQAIRKLSVVRQKQQSRAHLVETADCVNPLGDIGHEVHDSWATRGVVVGGNIALGLVHGDVGRSFVVNLLAIDRDAISTGDHLRSEFSNDLAVDGDSALKDVLLTSAA